MVSKRALATKYSKSKMIYYVDGAISEKCIFYYWIGNGIAQFDLISTFIIITVLFIMCLLNIPYFYLLDDKVIISLKLSKSKVKYTIFV